MDGSRRRGHDLPDHRVRAPRRFVDEMVRGPFTRFHHAHHFEPHGDAIRMTDLVEFQMPGWFTVNTVATAYLRHLPVARNAFIRRAAERA